MTGHVVPAVVSASLLVMTGMHASQTPAPRNLPYTAVHDPQFISAADATFMNHDDRLKPKTMVLGLDVGGTSKAFPLDALRRVRVINDLFGGKPVLVVHQPKSDTTTAFVARVAGKTLTFEAANAEASALVDRQTGSRWDPYGACVSGSLKGSALEPIVLEPEYWFAWSEFHRDTTIYTPRP